MRGSSVRPCPEHRGRAVRRAWMCALAGLALLAARPVTAQESAVGGVVLSEQSAQPMPNVQVSVAGTILGAVTDAAGHFRIGGVTGPQVTLSIRRIGYQPIVRVVNVGDLNLRFSMVARAVELNSVVVTGTAGETQSRAVGNSVAQIGASDITATQPVPDLQSLIMGRAAGVAILPSSGQIGTGAKIRIRGASSLSLSNEPLIYVDGVRVDNAQATGPTNQSFGSRPISRWNDFNPDDIESIEIIKGPAAATLYGTEASNGVVQIITKKGTQGRASWNLVARGGANWFNNPEGRLYTNYWQDPSTNAIDSIDIVSLEEKRGSPIFRTGSLQQYDLNVSAGSPLFRYYLGGGTEANQGSERNNDLRRYNGRANLSLTPNERWDIAANLGYTTSRVNLGFEAGGGGTAWTTYYATPENLTTAKRGFQSGPPETYYSGFQSYKDLDRFTGSIIFNHRPLTWFSQRMTFGTDQVNEDNQEIGQKNDQLSQFFSELGDPTNGYMQVSTRVVTYNTYDYGANARFDLGNALVSTTSFGAQYYSRLTRRREAYGEGFPATGLKSLHSLSYIEIDEDDRLKNTTVGLYVQEQVGLNNRLFLTGAVRGDDNSAFGAKYKAAYYPKASVSYVVSEEPFWSRVPAVNSLKLRAAYGQSGQQPDVFAAIRTFVPGGGGTVTPGDFGNENLGPERSSEVELGFDAGLLSDRLGIEFTLFNDKTKDAILSRNVAPSIGFAGFQYFNAGEVSKHGLELLLRGTPVNLDNAALDLSFSYSRNTNEIKSLGGATRITAGQYIEHRVGYPVGSWYGRKILSAQLDGSGDAINVMCSDGNGGSVDCSNAPDVFLGNTIPKSEGAFTAGLTLYRNLRLNSLLDFKTGFKKLDGNQRVRCNLFDLCRINYYPQEFDPRQVAEAQGGSSYRTFLIRDASYAKLREISATYTLPPSWVSRGHFNRAAITLAGRNLHTWTKWPGLEPEASFNGGSRGYGQWEQCVIPQLMQFVATINLGF